MISQSAQPVTANYRTVSKRATTMADGMLVTFNITNFQSVWIPGHKKSRKCVIWDKKFQTNTTGNVTAHSMHAQVSFL
jgi:hypothetical protein